MRQRRPFASRLRPSALAALCLAMTMPSPSGAFAEPNYDEAAVTQYTLPRVLAGPDGKDVSTAEAWRSSARPHQLALLERHIYGRRLPSVPVRAIDLERAEVELTGGVKAVRLQATLALGDAADPPTTEVLVYLPALPAAARDGTGKVPVFLSLNFRGNEAEHPDPGIRLSRAWMPADKKTGIVDNRATEASRGSWRHGWPAEDMLARGYGMATAYCGDVFPDRADGRPASALAKLGRPVAAPLPADEPGAIATWAWQLSRILDWLLTLPEVAADRVIVAGHSRLGKTALWAGACDERFAMVVSNESGCGGAALSRRNYGETVASITAAFPHWFCPDFATFADRVGDLPCDQHTLLAMTAPRPLYVASAIEDRWADPRGEFLAAVAAEPAWKLFGLTGLGTTEQPPVDTPVGERVGYHVRTGQHDLLAYDWRRFADFADHVLKGRPRP